MRRIFLSVFILLFFTGNVNASLVLVDRIVAVVNNTPITSYELVNLAPFYGISNEKKLLNTVIDDYILMQYAQDNLNINVTNNDIQSYIARVAQTNGLTAEELENKVKTEGFDWHYYKEGIKLMIYSHRAVHQLFGGDVIINEFDIKHYYELHKSEFTKNPIITVDIISSNNLKNMKIAKRLLDSHKNFETIKKQYSQTKGSPQDIPLSDFGSSVRPIVESLQTGEISPIIQTKNGYFIIKLINKNDNLSSSIVRNKIMGILMDKKIGAKVNDWLSSMRKRFNIEIFK